MKNSNSKKAAIFMTLAVALSVFLFGVNSAFSLDPPASSVSPTFNGVNLTGPLKIKGEVGEVGTILQSGGDGAVAKWVKAAVDAWVKSTDGKNLYSNIPGNIGIGTNDPQSKLEVYGGNITSKLANTALLNGGNISADRSISTKGGVASSFSVSGANLAGLDMSLIDVSATSMSGAVIGGNVVGMNSVVGNSIGSFYRMGYSFYSAPNANGAWKYAPCRRDHIAVSCSTEVYNKGIVVNSFPARSKTGNLPARFDGIDGDVKAHSCYTKEFNSTSSEQSYYLWVKCFDPWGGSNWDWAQYLNPNPPQDDDDDDDDPCSGPYARVIGCIDIGGIGPIQIDDDDISIGGPGVTIGGPIDWSEPVSFHEAIQKIILEVIYVDENIIIPDFDPIDLDFTTDLFQNGVLNLNNFLNDFSTNIVNIFEGALNNIGAGKGNINPNF